MSLIKMEVIDNISARMYTMHTIKITEFITCNYFLLLYITPTKHSLKQT